MSRTIFYPKELASTAEATGSDVATVTPEEYTNNDSSGMELTGFLDGPYPLEPLISTDTGSYLAAAAMFVQLT